MILTRLLNITITIKWDERQFAEILRRLITDDSGKASEVTGQLRDSETKLKNAVASNSTQE